MTARLKRHLCSALEARLSGRPARTPDAGLWLMEIFGALSRQRGYNPHGPNPITWEAVAAWCAIMRQPLAPYHADIIMALDQVWLDHAYRKTTKAPDGVKVLPPISEHPISAALIDVAFG